MLAARLRLLAKARTDRPGGAEDASTPQRKRRNAVVSIRANCTFVFPNHVNHLLPYPLLDPLRSILPDWGWGAPMSVIRGAG